MLGPRVGRPRKGRQFSGGRQAGGGGGGGCAPAAARRWRCIACAVPCQHAAGGREPPAARRQGAPPQRAAAGSGPPQPSWRMGSGLPGLMGCNRQAQAGLQSRPQALAPSGTALAGCSLLLGRCRVCVRGPGQCWGGAKSPAATAARRALMARRATPDQPFLPPAIPSARARPILCPGIGWRPAAGDRAAANMVPSRRSLLVALAVLLIALDRARAAGGATKCSACRAVAVRPLCRRRRRLL